MKYNYDEIMQYIEENDVKFIRLSFCDIFGVPKNVSILPSELKRAFEYGIGIDASLVDGFGGSDEVVYLRPDKGNLSSLPWRPSHGRVIRLFCDVKKADDTSLPTDTRKILRRMIARDVRSQGLVCNVGSECEFYLLKLDSDGEPTNTPFDHATYMDIAPIDRGENVRREICLDLESMGIYPLSSHHEQGPGQNEIDFKYSEAVSAADDLITYQSVVRTVANHNGLWASFDPKPLANRPGNGLHINMSLTRDGVNIMQKETMSAFVAGISHRLAEITAFLNPTNESYERLEYYRGSIIIHDDKGEGRVEITTPDSRINPYIAFSLLICAGMEGIRENLTYDGKMPDLPETLDKAIALAEKSDFVKDVLTEEALDAYLSAVREK